MKPTLTELPPMAPRCRYRIDAGRKMRIEEYAGRVGLDELKDVAAAVAADPARSGEHNRLVDLSEAVLDLSSDEVLRFGLLMRGGLHRSVGWQAFAVGDDSTFSMVRMFAHWARTTERSRIFKTREEAEQWLERNSDFGPPDFAGLEVA